jgi:Anaphase-promoting complex, cyclosome, subunit 3/WD40-like Beta Propeller Repeat
MLLMKSLRLTLLTILVCIGLGSFAQTDTTDAGLFSSAVIPAKILSAKHEFHVNNMRGALSIYREVLDVEPNNDQALYGIAQCHYNLKKYKLALEYAHRADKNGAGVPNLFYGQCYHRQAELDKAIESYEKYKSTVRPGSYDAELADMLIGQCKYAQEQMRTPVNVTITNMGKEINSRFEEYAPSVTADGKLLVFTSRRSDTKGNAIDEHGDYKYFEDIYSSDLQPDGTWADAKNLPGDVNTEAYDGVLSILPSGQGIYVYRNKGESAGDIFYSDRNASDGTWKAATKISRPINTSYYEGSISVTADGSAAYFISERPEGLGQGDIYVSHKKGSKWSSPKNIGKLLNTDNDEKFVFVHPNGKVLYFASNGHQGMGSYDLFRSEMVNGTWSAPVNLGYPINTVNEESTFSLTGDNKTLYLSAEYDDSFGERDIYKVDVSKYNLISAEAIGKLYGQLICTVKNVASGSPMKGVKVRVLDAAGNEVFQGETDKAGYCRTTLPLSQSYKVETTDKTNVQTKDVEMTPKEMGETVVKVDFTY